MMCEDSLTVFIIDDDRAIREAVSLMLVQAGISVKAFDKAEDFLNHYKLHSLGCALVDIRMPDMDGISLQQELLKRDLSLPIIFLTGHGSIPLSVIAIKGGACDFLTKPISREKLLRAIHTAFDISKKNSIKNNERTSAKARIADLTEREREVAKLAIAGKMNKEIARELGISHRTVEIHKSRIMTKTRTHNLLDLARIANEAELMPGNMDQN